MSRRRTARAAAFAALVCVPAWLGAGCGVTDEVVATLAPPEAGPPLVVPGQPCATQDDCGGEDAGSAFFCSKASCGAAMGTCQEKPTTCPNAFGFVCGCTTGLLYWNDCLRQLAGDSAAGSTSSGDCVAKTKTCTMTTGECPSGSSCALPKVGGCSAATDPSRPDIGVCWVLPSECPTVTLPGVSLTTQVFSCKTLACTDFCTAVLAGSPFAPTCPIASDAGP